MANRKLSKDGRTLDLSFTDLTTLEGIFLPQSLEKLDLSYTDISSLHGIALPQNLQRLYLHSSRIKDLEGITLPQGLQTLDLSDTELTSISSVPLPQKLKLLNLSGTKLTSLEGITLPQGLQQLDLRSTNLLSLKGIELPQGLQRLELSHTKLTNLEGVELPQELKWLNLAHTNFTTLKGIELPQGLRDINLYGTPLVSLEGVTLPQGLQNLGMGKTHLTNLEGVALPLELKGLYLQSTQVTRLPETIRELKALKKLNLCGLHLKELPDWLPELKLPFARKQLADGILLYNTTVEGVDMSIFDQSQEAILQWFEERKKQDDAPLNEIKVVFLGDGDVGKTHTISRLQKDGEKIPESSTGGSTPGIAISDKTYPIDGQNIQVHFWDFGGQDILYSMHRMFMTERTIYVVMVDARKENCGAQATEWLDTIRSFAGDAPVLLVVNKTDQNSNATLDRPGLTGKYENLKQIIYMSSLCDEPEEFNSKFTDAMKELIRQSDVPKMTWPKNWKRVKDELQNMDEPYIRSREYGKICARCEVDSGGEGLLNWCNDLGVCFCRQDDRLKDYVILRPDWITNAVYAVLFNKRDKVKNGLIDLSEMFRLLNSDETRKTFPDIPYEWGDMNYILDVVRKFSLSYQVDGNTEFFPMLCSADSSPKAKEYAEAGDALEFHMEFQHLPGNILHRLMVERYGELDTDNVWLTGARFCQKDTKLSAVVRKDGNRLKLYVRSEDPQHAANTYLSVIAGTVEQICKSLNLKISRRLVIYKENSQRVEFDYEALKFALERGKTEILCWELRKDIPLSDILKQSGHSADTAKQEFIRNLTDACRKLQSNPMYWNVGEDARTTGLRDVLSNRYITMDQHLTGIGAGGKKSGEMDLDIRLESNTPWTAIEALNISGAQFTNWDSHLNKLLTNYNHEGRAFLFHVSYVSADMDKFGDIIAKFWDHVQKYHPPKMPIRFANWMSLAREHHDEPRFVRAMECVYDCGGIPMTVYHFFVRMGR